MKEPKLKVNNKFRFSTNQIRFGKDYPPGWTDEILHVALVYKGNLPYNKIIDLGGDILIGTFYENELQKIYKDDDVFQIKTILKNVGARKMLNIW